MTLKHFFLGTGSHKENCNKSAKIVIVGYLSIEKLVRDKLPGYLYAFDSSWQKLPRSGHYFCDGNESLDLLGCRV